MSSFGTICHASLVAPVARTWQAVAKVVSYNTVPSGMNTWALAYASIHPGQLPGYRESASQVSQLFQERGWETTIVAHDLVGNALFYISCFTGGIVSFLGQFCQMFFYGFASNGGDNKVYIISGIFFFAQGCLLTSMLLSIVAGGVKAVLVLWAHAPQVLAANHSEVCARLQAAWDEHYPDHNSVKIVVAAP